MKTQPSLHIRSTISKNNLVVPSCLFASRQGSVTFATKATDAFADDVDFSFEGGTTDDVDLCDVGDIGDDLRQSLCRCHFW